MNMITSTKMIIAAASRLAVLGDTYLHDRFKLYIITNVQKLLDKLMWHSNVACIYVKYEYNFYIDKNFIFIKMLFFLNET